jgi:hypothetical protein
VLKPAGQGTTVSAFSVLRTAETLVVQVAFQAAGPIANDPRAAPASHQMGIGSTAILLLEESVQIDLPAARWVGFLLRFVLHLCPTLLGPE